MNISDTVYKNVKGDSIGEYVVMAEISRLRDGSIHVEYELECKFCQHGKACHVIVREVSPGVLEYVKMAGDSEDTSEHACWHKSTTEPHTLYYTDRDILQGHINTHYYRHYDSQIESLYKTITAYRKEQLKYVS